jgi:hypothetical protein
MSATEHLEKLSLALNEGRPIVLLLGQDAWRSGMCPDPVLEAALKRSERGAEKVAAGFPALLDAVPLAEDFYDWLADTYLRQPESPWTETIARLPLNAVFTSSIDPALTRAFRVNGRDVEVVMSKLDNPDAPRHRRNLHITYLFGRAGEKNSSEMPPKSARDLMQRNVLQTTPLLSRIVETTTSLGVLLIDGLTCGMDWLGIELLYGALSAFSPGQVYWFGWAPEDTSQEFNILRDLAAPEGPIIFVRERLSTAIRSLELAGKIDITGQQLFSSDDSVTIGDHVLELEPAIRLKTSTAASIMDDRWLGPLPILGSEAEYAEFRRFHGHVEDAHRLVEGMRRGFAIERTFEKELNDRVRWALANVGRNQEPVLIHGQSGSGKSLALARLAYKVREQRKYPVLLASRVMRMPAVDELDEFCLRVEEVGAQATLLVCDANAPASRYRELLHGFQSRGRRVVVVGSTYRIIDHKEDENLPVVSHLLEVPAELNEGESGALAELLRLRTGMTLHAVRSKYLLPAIYHMIPDVRPRLAAGLAREARVAEDDLRGRGTSKSNTAPKPNGALGQALVNAGLVDPKELLDQKLEDFLGNMSDAASKAIDFVMVPGKLDCRVPVNLLMRAVGGSENLVDIATLFLGIDLFRWSLNDEDDVFVHPRLQVEAELISARRLGTSRAEAEVAIRLLASANPGSYGSSERRFVLDFVHKLGPDGPFGKRYAHSYLDIARVLTEMRTKRGFKDPSLMLQEATLRRRVLRDAPSMLDIDPASVLEEARQVVDLALDEFGASTSRGLRRMCANLKVERAAIYGFRASQRLKTGASPEEVWQYYEAARDSARTAVFAADTYFAIDVSVWVPNDLLREGNWDAEKRAELVADIWDGLERVDLSQLDEDQHAKYEGRRLRVSQTLDDKRLEKDALVALEQLGSRAGIFLQAWAIGGSLRGRGGASDEDFLKAEQVVAFMKEHSVLVQDDARCLRYFLRALWTIATRSYLFGGERSPLPGSEDAVQEILKVLDRLGGIEGSLGDPRVQYLRAVLLWRTQREHAARELWRSISQETDFSDPRRIVRHHVWTDSFGQPQLFHGRVIADNVGQGRVRIQVEGIRQEIELLERDFPQLDLLRGSGVQGGFYIAFNFIGPVAEPLGRRGGGR